MARLWEQILEALNESRLVPDSLQMIEIEQVERHRFERDLKGLVRV